MQQIEVPSSTQIACEINHYMQNVVEDIRFSNYTQANLADVIGICRETLNKKLKDIHSMRGDELLTVLILLNKIKTR